MSLSRNWNGVMALAVAIATAVSLVACSGSSNENADPVPQPQSPPQKRSAPLKVNPKGSSSTQNDLDFGVAVDGSSRELTYTANADGDLEVMVSSLMAVGCPSMPKMELNWNQMDGGGGVEKTLPLQQPNDRVTVRKGVSYILTAQVSGLSGCMGYSASILVMEDQGGETPAPVPTPVPAPTPAPVPSPADQFLGEDPLTLGSNLSMEIQSFNSPQIYKDFRLSAVDSDRNLYFGSSMSSSSCDVPPTLTYQWFEVQADKSLKEVASFTHTRDLKAEARKEYLLRLRASDYRNCYFAGYSFEVNTF